MRFFFFTAICTVSGDYVKTFDEERYALKGSCPYTISQARDDPNKLKIVSQALSCSYASGRNCGQKITIWFKIGSKNYRFKFIPLYGCVKILEENSEEKTICYSVYNTDYGLIIRPWYKILYIKNYGITIIYKQIRLGGR